MNAQGAQQDDDRERNQHGHQHQGCSTHSHPQQQEQSAKDFKPWQGRSYQVEQQIRVNHLVLTEQFEEFHRMERLIQPHVNEEPAENKSRQHRQHVGGTPASGYRSSLEGNGFAYVDHWGLGRDKAPLRRAPVSTSCPLLIHSLMPPAYTNKLSRGTPASRSMMAANSLSSQAPPL